MMEKESNYESKGTVEENIGAIITLVIGIGVGVLVLIFVNVLGGGVFNTIEPDIDSIGGSIGNETITLADTTNVSLAHQSIFNPVITNGTSVDISANVTIFNAEGYVMLTAGNDNFSGLTAYVSYDYGSTNVSNSIKSGIISGFEALEKTGNYIPIIVLAVIIGLVLAIVLGMGFVGIARSGGNGGAL